MPTTKNGVIITSTGDLLRAGFSDFQNDGTFDSGTESYRTDVPMGAKTKGNPDNADFHRWNGSAWVLITQGVPIGDSSLTYRVQSFSAFRLWKECYYTTDIDSPSGFSGFSGMGRCDEYLYSGIKILGFSSTYFDTAGQATGGKLTKLSTGPNGEKIFREIR